MDGHGQNGPVQYARITPRLLLPYQQGYIGTSGSEFIPADGYVFRVGGAAIGTMAPPTLYFGPPFAPGQGGDTPGGGGGLCGQRQEVETSWFTNGAVNPQAIVHLPGVTSWASSRARRSGA